jgi:hypothetical protein
MTRALAALLAKVGQALFPVLFVFGSLGLARADESGATSPGSEPKEVGSPCANGLRTIARKKNGLVMPEHLWASDYLHLQWNVARRLETAPLRWDRNDWCEVTLGIGVIGATSTLDRAVRDQVQAHRSAAQDRFMKVWQNLGSIGSFVVLGGFEAWGESFGYVRAKSAALNGLAASILSAGIATPGFKVPIGTPHPIQPGSTRKLKSLGANASFPSGHATQAFAVAMAISQNYTATSLGVLA